MIWCFTKYGFFSAVCARKGDGRRTNPPDPHRMMIRARDRGHLEALQERFPSLKQFELFGSKTNDYRFRIFIPKWRWQRVMTGLLREQDYDNFKSAVDTFHHHSKEGDRYHSALMRIWSVMYGFQTDKYGAGIYTEKKKRKRKRRKKGQRVLFDEPNGGPEKPEGAEELYYDEDLDAWIGVGKDGRRAELPADDPAQNPSDGAEVLVVVDDDTGKDVGIVLFPDKCKSDAHAYMGGVKGRQFDIVAHPAYQRMPWSEAKRLQESESLPVFRPQT